MKKWERKEQSQSWVPDVLSCCSDYLHVFLQSWLVMSIIDTKILPA